ncbi:hypothetical protein [Nocardioides ultimimeridianus]
MPTYDVYEPPQRRTPEPPVYDERRRPPVRRHRRMPAPFLGGAVVWAVVIWAISGAGYFWPMWVIVPALWMTWGGGRRRC